MPEVFTVHVSVSGGIVLTCFFTGEGMLGAKIVVEHVCQYGSTLVVVAAVCWWPMAAGVWIVCLLVVLVFWCFGGRGWWR